MQDRVSKLVQSCLIVVLKIHWYSLEKGHSGKPWEFFAKLSVKLWWQTQRKLRKHVCIDFCQRSCFSCLYEKVSILLSLIPKLRGGALDYTTAYFQILFSVLKHNHLGWHLRNLCFNAFMFKCKEPKVSLHGKWQHAQKHTLIHPDILGFTLSTHSQEGWLIFTSDKNKPA